MEQCRCTKIYFKPHCYLLFQCGDNSQNWKGNLAMVHSYIQQKSRKEEEIRRQQLRQQELENEEEQLKSKAQQLQQAIKVRENVSSYVTGL